MNRKQYEKFTKDQLLDELMKFGNMNDQFAALNKKIDNFSESHNKLIVELATVKKENNDLKNRLIKVEKNLLKTSQYHRREILEVNEIPLSIPDNQLESTICQALSLSGVSVSPVDIQSIHRTKKLENVIIKFSDRKKRNDILSKRKVFMDMKKDLLDLKLNSNFYINESLCIENSELFYFTRVLKKKNKIHSTWFANNTVNVKVDQSSPTFKIFHKSELETILKLDDLDNFISNL